MVYEIIIMNKDMKRLLCMLAFASLGLSVYAQIDSVRTTNSTLSELKKVNHSKYIPVFQYWKEHDIFQHLDASVTLGTSGIGIDVASPVTEWAQLRLGYEFMPHFTKNMRFEMTINGKPARSYDEDGNRQETNFDKLKEFLYDFSGYDVEDHADMLGKATINNFKLLVDVFPFKEHKNWHFTAGFYWGPSQFAEAVNTTETMVSLVAAGIYNSMYEKAVNNEPLIDFSKFTDMSNVYVMLPQEAAEKLKTFGRVGFAVGSFTHDVTDAHGVTHSAGDLYIVEPDESSMIRVKAHSNSFKPYIGFGYGGNLIKNRDDWKVSFDCGAMFWGGTPSLFVAHDGIDLTKDVNNYLNSQVDSYISLLKAVKVYPVLSLRLTKRIF